MFTQVDYVDISMVLKNDQGVYAMDLYQGLAVDKSNDKVSKINQMIDDFIVANDLDVRVHVIDNDYKTKFFYIDVRNVYCFVLEIDSCLNIDDNGLPLTVTNYVNEDSELYEEIDKALSWFFNINNSAALLIKNA